MVEWADESNNHGELWPPKWPTESLKIKSRENLKKYFIPSEIIFTLKNRRFERPQSILYWIRQAILSCETSKLQGGMAEANLAFWYIFQCLKYQTNYTCLEDSLLFLTNRTYWYYRFLTLFLSLFIRLCIPTKSLLLNKH